MENTALDVTFTDDVRISVSVIEPPSSPPPPEAAAAALKAPKSATASKSAKTTREAPPSTPRYTVHLTGNVDDAYETVKGGGEEDDDEDDDEDQDRSESEESGSDTASEDENRSDTQSDASSASWGSGDDMDVDAADDDDGDVEDGEGDGTGGGGGGGSSSCSSSSAEARRKRNGDDDEAVACRRAAADAGARTGRWSVPDVADETTMSFWEAREGSANSEWAYHVQTSGARQHRRSPQMLTSFAWTGDLRPALVSPRRRVPSVGWLAGSTLSGPMGQRV